MSKIIKVEIHEFEFKVDNLTREGLNQTITYKKGGGMAMSKYAVVVQAEGELQGEYVTQWVGGKAALGQTITLAPRLIGKNAEDRIGIYEDLKREIRQFDHMGHGSLDIALWDLAGKKLGVSISELLGGYRKKLPTYASTYHGDRNGGLNSKEDYAEFASRCFQMGYTAFKIHGWNEGNPREEAENLLYVADKVGDKMVLMYDAACELKTFADALYVGRACDEGHYLWYEDPFRDAGTSAFAQKKLRELIKTPILITEHVRGVEPKADLLIAGGTDFLRCDPEYDMGITGALKIAHLGEAFGIDVEIHACGPAHRHLMSAMRNSNYYELALVGPDCSNAIPPVYACDYSDQLDAIDKDGCVHVPAGPGLGVVYDWEFIKKNRIQLYEFK